MNLALSQRAEAIRAAVEQMVTEEIIPREAELVAAIGHGDRWAAPDYLEPLKA